MQNKKKAGGKGGGRLARSEIVTVRFNPQLRYLIELAARKQRRTVSSLIECEIEKNLSKMFLKEAGINSAAPVSVEDEKDKLWDTEEADRFAKLAFNYPELLNHYEQVLWRLIKENGYVWNICVDEKTMEYFWDGKEQSLNFKKLQETWERFQAVAMGDADKSTLPQWGGLGSLKEK